jgi:hypothetical protein
MSHSVLTVILKGEDWSHRKKFNLYEDYKNDENDPVVSECIQATRNAVKETPEDVEFKTSKVIK